MPQNSTKPEPLQAPSSAGHVGAEPGINPRRTSASENYGHFKQDCIIEVADYTTNDISVKRLGNAEFVELLKEPNPPHHPPHMGSTGSLRTGVRWVNIGGIDWGVMSALALKYDLHSLALEDVIHEQGHTHSKADYYHEHLFIRILCHSLGLSLDPADDIADSTLKYPSAGSKDSILERGDLQPVLREVMEKAAPSHPRDLTRRVTGLAGFSGPARQQQLLKIRALTKGDRVNVKHEAMFIYLLRNGTVISIHPSPSIEFTAPIRERILQPQSILRTSEDASLLVESLLDLVVDRVLEVVDAYQDKIHQLEHDVLLKPNMNTVRRLHILSGDLIMHKRTLEPVKAMLYGLRLYDTDRYIALADNAGVSAEPEAGQAGQRNIGAREAGEKVPGKVQGYLSYKAKVYLADVYDHIDYALTSLDMFAGIAENLISYAFNMASYEMNQVMRRLTLATIIFLPLTLLTGYFGMNFSPFPAVNNHSDILYVPLFSSLLSDIQSTLLTPPIGQILDDRATRYGGARPVFMFTDIMRIMRYLGKRMAAHESVKGFKTA